VHNVQVLFAGISNLTVRDSREVKPKSAANMSPGCAIEQEIEEVLRTADVLGTADARFTDEELAVTAEIIKEEDDRDVSTADIRLSMRRNEALLQKFGEYAAQCVDVGISTHSEAFVHYSVRQQTECLSMGSLPYDHDVFPLGRPPFIAELDATKCVPWFTREVVVGLAEQSDAELEARIWAQMQVPDHMRETMLRTPQVRHGGHARQRVVVRRTQNSPSWFNECRSVGAYNDRGIWELLMRRVCASVKPRGEFTTLPVLQPGKPRYEFRPTDAYVMYMLGYGKDFAGTKETVEGLVCFRVVLWGSCSI
jgi:hypothetical protein